jgi:hypothetical protein
VSSTIRLLEPSGRTGNTPQCWWPPVVSVGGNVVTDKLQNQQEDPRSNCGGGASFWKDFSFTDSAVSHQSSGPMSFTRVPSFCSMYP